MEYQNPILPGFHPDPSVCRVGGDFYLVNSSFEFFPGVPLYHSRNLADWELLGYCLNTEEQLNLKEAHASGGIYAPTIRWHEGVFFMTTTNVSDRGNFIVHTRNLSEGWSEPCWVEQGGIDPSLFFDDDGTVYFLSTGNRQDGTCMIQMCEVDPFSGKQLTPSIEISLGCGGKFPEGPHIYKRYGYYYLMLAEGGTEYGHMETIQRATTPYGPYEPCPHNPILTHRDDSRGEIFCTGHGDLVEDQNGNWWMVCLGTRCLHGAYAPLMQHHLGRETFLAPVMWDKDGWPKVGENGKISPVMDGPLPAPGQSGKQDEFVDCFEEKNFDLCYNFLRNPQMEQYVRDSQHGELLLKGNGISLNDGKNPTWLGIRQREFNMCAETILSLKQKTGKALAGLTAFYNENYHYEIYLTREQEGCFVCLAKHVHDIFVVTEKRKIESDQKIHLWIESDEQQYRFYYGLEQQERKLLGTALPSGLASEGTCTMTFTGTYIAMFAECGEAAFQYFKCKFQRG